MPKWTLPARHDLQAQLEFIERDNPDMVGPVAATIRKATESLDTFPQIGRNGSVDETVELVIPRLPFVCIYRLRNGQVEILRLLHDRMQWPR